MEITKGETYKHYKGGLYTVLEIANMESTNEEVVVYERFKASSAAQEKIWVRPLKEFKEKFKPIYP